MKTSSSASLLFAFALASATTAIPVRAQTAVQPAQTPTQADQAREQDHNSAADVTVGQDWKAREGDRHDAAPANAERDHETIGRDWRAHDDRQDR